MIDPNEALQALLARSGIKGTFFPPTSRYHQVEMGTIEIVEGKPLRFLLRRFVPSSERFALLQEHVVVQGDRLDNVTAKYLTDPEQFWRVCDANDAMRPEELTEEIGRHVRITLPEGVPGNPHA